MTTGSEGSAHQFAAQLKVQDPAQSGFTLTELAVVLVIVGLLIGGMLIPLGAQDELRRVAETQKTLADIRDALTGYAIANDRLPCPARATSNGFADPPAAAPCHANSSNGFVPAATLGITPTDSAGFAIDAWGNRIRYVLTTSNGSAFSDIGIRGYYLANANTLPASDVRVCASATPISGTKCASPETTNTLTNNAVAVIFSVGRNGGDGGGADEAINLGANPIFVYHPPTPSGSANGEFDDIVTWISPNILYNRMVAAGRLP